jgi:hypothetical protein
MSIYIMAPTFVIAKISAGIATPSVTAVVEFTA